MSENPITAKVAIVIVNWNNWQDTEKCLRWLAAVSSRKDGCAAAGSLDTEVFVVDNGSTDDSAQRLSLLDVTLLALPENVGFAAGCNQGIRAALARGADYVLFLNNDTNAEADFLAPLLATFDAHPRCGIVCPKIRYAGEAGERSERIWYAGGRFRQPRLIGEMVGLDETDVGQYDSARVVDFAVGCCMLIKSELLGAIGLMDEAFFFYHEDVDFSLRATQAGYEVWYQPASLIWHQVSSSTQEDLGFRAFLYARSRPIFFVKHIHGLQWVPVLALECVRLVRMVARSLLQRRPEQGMGYLRGTLQGWRSALTRDRGEIGLDMSGTEHKTQ